MTEFTLIEALQSPVGIIAVAEMIMVLFKTGINLADIKPEDTRVYKLLVILIVGSITFIFNPMFLTSLQNIFLGLINTMLMSGALMGLYDLRE